MCGRFLFISEDKKLEKRFRAKVSEPLIRHYNAAPAQKLPIITNQHPDLIILGLWGLKPSWLKNNSATGLINARVETLAEKPAFRQALKQRRCLIIADGFFEWDKEGGTKRPYHISLLNSEPFAFAGLWELFETKKGESIPSFSIITTCSNNLVARIHHRMPVILNPNDEKIWLNSNTDVTKEINLTKPFPEEQMKICEVSDLVNSFSNDSPEILEPVKRLL